MFGANDGGWFLWRWRQRVWCDILGGGTCCSNVENISAKIASLQAVAVEETGAMWRVVSAPSASHYWLCVVYRSLWPARDVCKRNRRGRCLMMGMLNADDYWMKFASAAWEREILFIIVKRCRDAFFVCL